MQNIKIYGQSQNGNIQCLGIRLEDGLVREMPMDNRCRMDRQALVGSKVVFYNSELDKYYDVEVLEYIKAKNGKYVVKYKNEKSKEIQCGDFIKRCQIGNIVKERLIKHPNEFYQVEDYWIMTIKIKGTTNESYFDTEYVEVKFSGEEETIEAIMNSSWCIIRSAGNKFYIQTGNFNNTGKKARLHQILFEELKKGNVIDHINGDTLDNRLENLREVDKKQNSRNKKGAGFPSKHGKGWRYKITIDGNKICTPTRKTYSQADLDALIVQGYYNYSHREDEFYKIDKIDEQYKNELITLMEEKLEKAKRKKSIFTKNEYEMVDMDGQEIVKVYGKDKDTFTYISKEDLRVLDEGRLWFVNNYWSIRTNKIALPLHRYILGIKQTSLNHIQVDHLNQDTNDNRRSNLVATTEAGNKANKDGKGYGLNSSNSYQVQYRNYFNIIKDHNSITKVGQPSFKTKQEAKEEVFKRKWLVNYIRPQFKNYKEYLTFEEEYNANRKDGQNIDDYWITSRFPKINEIKIPNFTEKDMDKL